MSVTDPVFPSHRDILQHERWLTALVAGLVAPGEVDDVLQGTWLAALEQPPRRRSSTRAWLSTVARNLAIDSWKERRRQRRSEERAARTEAMPSTEETVDRLTTIELLLGVVRELPEPARTAVLLRHYHGLSVRELAERLGVSEAAARQRVKRGLDEVRRRLIDRAGPRWRERLLALLAVPGPGAGPTPASPLRTKIAPTTVLGGLMMNAKTLMLCGAGGVLAGGAVLVALLQSPEPPVAEPTRPAIQQPSAVIADGIPDPNRVPVRTAAVPADATVGGRVLGVHGEPVPRARILGPDGAPLTQTDAEGRFSFAGETSNALRVEPRFHTVRRHAPDGNESDWLFIVAPSVQVSGTVATRSGEPLEVEISVEMRGLIDFPAPLEQTRPVGLSDGASDGSGDFSFDSLPGGVCRLRFEKPGYRTAVHEVGESDTALGIVLEQAPGGVWSISGQVFDPAGWAIPDAIVGLGDNRVPTDAYGHYDLFSTREELAQRGRALYAAKPGYQTCVDEEPGIGDFDADRRLRRDLTLPGPALSISGTVRQADGRPAADAVVALWQIERMPGTGFAEDLATPPEVEPQEYGVAPRRVYAVADEAGGFELRGLMDQEYSLRILHPELLAMTSDPIRAGTRGVELRYPADNLRTFRCRVINIAGEPISGIRIDTSMQSHQTSGSSIWDMVDDLHTDARGEIVLPRVLRNEGTQVRVRSDEIITAIETIQPDAVEPVEIVVERRCFFRVECSDPKWASASFSLETAAGELTWISSTRGTYNAEYRLADGRSPVLTTSELAATIIVDDTTRIPISLVPGEVVVVQF